MPSGYTHSLTAETPLRQFALDCARAFGALIEMRDEPADAPIKLPEADDYYGKKLVETRNELLAALSMSLEEAEAASQKQYDNTQASRAESIVKMTEKRAVYRQLTAKVLAWTPPTTEHEGLKKFMLEQLRDSDKFDNGTLDRGYDTLHRLSGKDWLEGRIHSLESSIAYYEEQQQEEIKRVAERRQWIIDLQNSLPS